MKSLKINFSPAEDDELFCQSKWWGSADMPKDVDYPTIPYEDGDDPLTMVCQINCSDLAAVDTENLLPHEGMLYFFAAIDEYVYKINKDFDMGCDYFNGLNEWATETYRVIYVPKVEDAVPNDLTDENGEPYGLPAERITFEVSDDPRLDDFKLLGLPFYDEIAEQYPDHLCLLQIDGNDDWQMQLYDMGMICFLIRPDDLKALDFSKVKVYFHSC